MIINLCGGSGGGSSAPIKLQGLIAKENGTYTPDEEYDGYSEVLVDVTEPTEVFVVPDGMKFKGSTFTTIPDNMDFSEVSDMAGLFYDCINLQSLPHINTISATSMGSMFQNCTSLETIPQFITSNVNSMGYMFYNCKSLKTVPQMETSNVKSMELLFYLCSSLETIPQFNTSNVNSVKHMFNSCTKLTKIPQLNFGSVTNTNSIFRSTNLSSLTDLGGFTNLKVSWTTNFLDRVPKATVESLMNVINGLWDWTDYPDGNAPLNNGEIYNFGTTHSLIFGSTNLNKLTEEQIAVATNKGWTLTA